MRLLANRGMRLRHGRGAGRRISLTRQNLDRDEQLQMIPRISYCSRRLHELAEPLLYARLLLSHPWRDPYASGNKIGRLLRTFHSKPQLAGLVREIHIESQFLADYEETEDSDYEPDNEPEVDLSCLDVESRQWLRQRILEHEDQQCCSGFGEDWFKWLESSRNWEAVLAFLVLCNKNLQHLYIVGFHFFPDASPWFLNEVLHRAVTEQKSNCSNYFLSNLSHVYVDLEPINSPCTLARVKNFFQLSSVRKFEFYSLYDIPESIKYPATNSGSYAQDLTLYDAGMDYETEFGFIQCFNSLRKLHYIYNDHNDSWFRSRPGYDHLPRYGPRLDQYPSSPDLLNHLKPCLEDLAFIGRGRVYSEPEPALQTLFEFERLAKVEVMMYALLGGQDEDTKTLLSPNQLSRFLRILPASLKSLKIVDCRQCVFDCLEALWPLESKYEGLPNLEEVALEFAWDGSPQRDSKALEDWEYWVSRAKENGVRLERVINAKDVFPA